MAKPIKLPPGFDALSVEEKIDYVQQLWDRIATDADAVPLTAWQVAVLEARRDEPSHTVPWETLHERLRRTLSGKG